MGFFVNFFGDISDVQFLMTYLPTLSHYVRFFLRYLPTQKSDVLYERSLSYYDFLPNWLIFFHLSYMYMVE